MLPIVLAWSALGAKVTDMPPALRLDGGVVYDGRFELGKLREDTEDVGDRRLSDHTLTWRVEFAPVERFALWLAVEHTPLRRLAFEDAWSIGLDPATDRPTTEGGQRVGSVTREGAGLDGVWLGVAAAPFVERRAGPQATWRLDAALRTPDPAHTFWTADGDRRGVAPGGLGLLARGAFSVENEPADSYLVIEARWELPARVDVTDDGGDVVAPRAKVDAADRVAARLGSELTAWSGADGSSFGFDLFGDVGYVGTAQVPSGVLLPQVLDRTEGEIVSSGATVHLGAGAGMLAHATKWVAIRGAFNVGWAVPQRPEEVYPVVISGDTARLGVEASIEGRWR